jgi:hypothetical protein
MPQESAGERNQGMPVGNILPNIESSSSLSSLFRSSFYETADPNDKNFNNMLNTVNLSNILTKKNELIMAKPTLNDIEIEASFFKFGFSYLTRFFFYRDEKEKEFVCTKLMPHISYHVDRMKLNYTKEECTVVAIDIYHTTIRQDNRASSNIQKLVGKCYLVLEKNRTEKSVSITDIAGNNIHIKLVRKKCFWN